MESWNPFKRYERRSPEDEAVLDTIHKEEAQLAKELSALRLHLSEYTTPIGSEHRAA